MKKLLALFLCLFAVSSFGAVYQNYYVTNDNPTISPNGMSVVTNIAAYQATNSVIGRFPWTPAPTTNVSTVANLIAVVNTATSGTTIGILPGTYDLGTNNLCPRAGVNVVGAGSALVTLLGYADCWGRESFSAYQVSGGPQYHPGDNSIHQGFTLMCDTNKLYAAFLAGTNSGMWSGFGVSAFNPPANTGFTNVLARDIVVQKGWWDGFHFNPSNRCEIRFEYCGVNNDALGWSFESGTGSNTNCSYSLYNCYSISRGVISQPLIDSIAFADPALFSVDCGILVDGYYGLIVTNGNLAYAPNIVARPGASGTITMNNGVIVANLANTSTKSNIFGNFSFNATNVYYFYGNGAGLTNLNASELRSGTVSRPISTDTMTNGGILTKIIGTDSNGKLKGATLSGLTWDGTTLTASGSGTSLFRTNAPAGDGTFTNSNSGGASNVYVGPAYLAITNGPFAINAGKSPATPRVMVRGSGVATYQNTNSFAATNGANYSVMDAAGTFTNSARVKTQEVQAADVYATRVRAGTPSLPAPGLWGTGSSECALRLPINGRIVWTIGNNDYDAVGVVISNLASGLKLSTNLTVSGSVTATNGFFAYGNGVMTAQNTNSITGTNGSGFFVLDTTGNITNSGNTATTGTNWASKVRTGGAAESAADLVSGNRADFNQIRASGSVFLTIGAEVGIGRVTTGVASIHGPNGTADYLDLRLRNLVATNTVTATNGFSSRSNVFVLMPTNAAASGDILQATGLESSTTAHTKWIGGVTTELTNVFFTNTWAAVNNRIVTNYFALTTPRTGMYEVSFTYGTPTEGGGTTIDSSSYTTLFWTDPINGTVQSSDSFDTRTPAGGFNKWEYDKSYHVWAKSGTLLVVSNWMQDSFDGGGDTKSTNYVGAFIWARP